MAEEQLLLTNMTMQNSKHRFMQQFKITGHCDLLLIPEIITENSPVQLGICQKYKPHLAHATQIQSTTLLESKDMGQNLSQGSKQQADDF